MSKTISTKSNRKAISVMEFIGALPRFYLRVPKLFKAAMIVKGATNDKETSLTNFFLKSVKKFPNNTILYYYDKNWTYKEFNEWVNRLSNYFISLGFKKGDTAVISLENRPEVIAIALALAKIGCIASNVNSAQRNKPLIHSINLSKPKLILVGAEQMESYLEIEKELGYPAKQVLIIPHDEKKTDASFDGFNILGTGHSDKEPKFDYKIFAGDICMLVFTSGTTGLPKAAVISHARWIKAYAGFGLALNQFKPTDVVYVPLPFYHATAMMVCWTSVVQGGAAMVMNKKFSVSQFWPEVDKYKVTALGYVGELCKYLLNEPVHPLEKNNSLLKVVGNGMRPDIWMEFKERFGTKQVGEFYASSEGNLAFVNLFNLDCTMGYSSGKIAIVKYDTENETPIYNKKGFMIGVKKGEEGLLLGEINASYPFDGYTEKDKSEKAILRNVLKKGDAYFNTNDLVFNMGFSHAQFVDRLGDTYRWKGENVSTTEIEGIVNKFPGVAESIVYGAEIPNTSGRAGMAMLILSDSTKSVDFSALYSFFKTEMPPFAVPLFIRIATTKETTETMKYLKAPLKKVGYDVGQTTDELYFLTPEKEYIKITPEIKEKIDAGDYRL